MASPRDERPASPRTRGGLGQVLSPPLQALLWTALDVATSSALMAAWHYKWIASDAGEKAVARRQRPIEYSKQNNLGLEVLFDFKVERDISGVIFRTTPKTPPDFLKDAPGTPRHPAYPSGHSTYSAAASTVLECFFGKRTDASGNKLKGEFNKLARNIGEARLWGGVHWRSDDDAGRLIGNAVGELVIAQLTRTGIYDLLDAEFNIPPFNDLKTEAENFAAACGTKPSNFCQGLPKKEEVFQNLIG